MITPNNKNKNTETKPGLYSPLKKVPKIIKLIKIWIICFSIVGFISLGFPFYKNFGGISLANNVNAAIIDEKLFNKNYNVIIYVIDALRPDHLNIYGYPRSTSPFISFYARQGFFQCVLCLSNQGFHSFIPIISPSKAPPSAHHVISNIQSWLHQYAAKIHLFSSTFTLLILMSLIDISLIILTKCKKTSCSLKE